jgi:hypothetical protein
MSSYKVNLNYILTLVSSLVGLSIFVFLILLLSSCTFRLYHVGSTNGENLSYFDTEPPSFEVVYPKDGDILSNVVTIHGKAWDKSGFVVYSSVGDKLFAFTNANEWFFNLNTFDYTNGNIDFYFWAEDSLGNKSGTVIIRCSISNSSFISILPSQSVFVTNDSFSYTLNLKLESNREVAIFVNSNELTRFSNTNVFILDIFTNGYLENFTNELLVISSEMTNKRYFVFDFTSPNFVLGLNTNDYVWGDTNFSVFIQDTNNCYFSFSLGGGVTNTYLFGPGLTNVLLNTYSLPNGTNYLAFWARDVAGNHSSVVILPLVIGNFFVRNLCVDTKSKYFLDYEIVSNNIWLFFTDDSYNKIYLAREENNYQKETVRSSITVDRKIRAITVSNVLFVSYLNNSYSLYIRTNEVSNKLSSILRTITGVYDFEVSRTSNDLYLIRLHTNWNVVVSDITNRRTNFIISNIGNAHSIATEKYNFDEKFRISVIKTNPNSVEVYECGSNYYTKVFETNLAFEPEFMSISRVGNYDYLGASGTNRVSIFVLSNGNFVTNFDFTNNGKFFGISSSSYADGVVFVLYEFFYSSSTSNLKLLYFEGTNLRRNQDIGSAGNFDELIQYINIVPYSNKLRIFLPFREDNYNKGIAKFEGI